MKYQILLVEDDKKLQEIVKDYFISKDCEVTAVYNGTDALGQLEENTYHLILLDIMLPRKNGFEVCKEVRKTKEVPIIFITAKTEENDQLKGFLLGADDYVTKPFSLPVLYAKAEALINRARGSITSEKLQAGEVSVDRKSREVFIKGEKVKTAPKEYQMLVFFLEHPNQTFSREQLLVRFWGYDFEGNDRVIDSHIKKLRKVLGVCAGYLKTILKTGYKWEVPS